MVRVGPKHGHVGTKHRHVGRKPGHVGRKHVGARSNEAKFEFSKVGVEPKDARVRLKVMGVASDAFEVQSDELRF
jgi:hypothetical protein